MQQLLVDDPAKLGGYQLLGRLGAGGMGVVYIGRGPQGDVVAIKVVRPQYASDSEFRRRFMREVRVAQGMTGPGLVKIVAADADAAQPWLATEYIAGPTLADAVIRHGPLETPAWAGVAHQLGTALHTVHEAGIIHRDLKPANVLLSRTGPRLIDFGIARTHNDSALTNVGQAVGTIGYMAPEYLTTATADERADLFAFGAVLSYAATGRPLRARALGTGAIPLCSRTAGSHRGCPPNSRLTGSTSRQEPLSAPTTACRPPRDPRSRPGTGLAPRIDPL